MARQGNWLYYSQRFMRRHAFGVSAGAAFIVVHHRLRGHDVDPDTAHRRRARPRLAGKQACRAVSEVHAQDVLGLRSGYQHRAREDTATRAAGSGGRQDPRRPAAASGSARATARSDRARVPSAERVRASDQLSRRCGATAQADAGADGKKPPTCWWSWPSRCDRPETWWARNACCNRHWRSRDSIAASALRRTHTCSTNLGRVEIRRGDLVGAKASRAKASGSIASCAVRQRSGSRRRAAGPVERLHVEGQHARRRAGRRARRWTSSTATVETCIRIGCWRRRAWARCCCARTGSTRPDPIFEKSLEAQRALYGRRQPPGRRRARLAGADHAPRKGS